MILRKPYAFLIKYFKIIHLIIGVFSLILTFKISNILSFFNNYFDSNIVIINKGVASDLFGFSLYFAIILILLATISIIVLMAAKKKPIKLYIYTILTQIVIFAMMSFSYKNIKQLEVSAVDIRTLKLNSDFTLIILILEIICSILILVRATGFNIKKFNFGEDLEKLEITEKDNEEFEVSYEVDTNSIKRDIFKAIRDFKYLYGENKALIWLIGAVSVTVIVGSGTYYYMKNHKTYSLNTVFYYPKYQIEINGAYVTKYNYRNKVIDEDKVYVLVDVKANRTTKDIVAITTGAMQLEVEDHSFYPIKKEDTFLDLGTTYNGQKLQATSKSYLLVYELPKSFEKSKMVLTTHTETEKYSTKLSPLRIDENEKEFTYNLKDEIDFTDSIFKGIKVSFNSMEINDSFQVDYVYRLSNKETVSSIEIVRPTFTGSEDKTLMKLTGSFSTEEDIYLSNISFSTFIERYGKIRYQKEGKTYTMNMSMKTVTPKKVTLNKTVYLEVLDELKDAEQISLVFEVHSKTYSYQLK